MSITPLELESCQRPDVGFRPAIMEPMLRAADEGRDLVPPLQKIVAQLGFESFMYGLSTTTLPRRDALIYFFATLPREWSLLYDRQDYIEVDPRVTLGMRHCAPVPWDQGIAMTTALPRQESRVRSFVRCGSLRHSKWRRLGAPQSGPQRRSSGVEFLRARIWCKAAAVTSDEHWRYPYVWNLLSRILHAQLCKHRHSITDSRCNLNPREISVIELVARGLTADDIALKLGITVRTVRFHVDSARTKMGALNREEAVALVAKAGLISVLP